MMPNPISTPGSCLGLRSAKNLLDFILTHPHLNSIEVLLCDPAARHYHPDAGKTSNEKEASQTEMRPKSNIPSPNEAIIGSIAARHLSAKCLTDPATKKTACVSQIPNDQITASTCRSSYRRVSDN